MTFPDALVDAGEPIASARRPGKQALRPVDRPRVECEDPRRLTGSIDIDEAFSKAEPHSPRWDYGLGYEPKAGAECAVWVEVHPANPREVQRVLEKLGWLRSKLWERGGQIEEMTNSRPRPVKPFVWIASGDVSIRRSSPEAFRLNAAGLDLPRRHLRLP